MRHDVYEKQTMYKDWSHWRRSGRDDGELDDESEVKECEENDVMTTTGTTDDDVTISVFHRI